MAKGVQIGKVAQQTGLSVDTIRFYEKELRRSPKLTRLCSPKLTHSKNTICRWARHFHPRQRRVSCCPRAIFSISAVEAIQIRLRLPHARPLLRAGEPDRQSAAGFVNKLVGQFCQTNQGQFWRAPKERGTSDGAPAKRGRVPTL